jgi:hypothetical protein
LCSVIDLAEEKENNFSWTWFVVLGELCFGTPNVIDECNFQSLLLLLSKIQVSIFHPQADFIYWEATNHNTV